MMTIHQRGRHPKFASGTRKSTKTEGRIWTWWRKMISLWNGPLTRFSYLNASTFFKSLQCTRNGLALWHLGLILDCSSLTEGGEGIAIEPVCLSVCLSVSLYVMYVFSTRACHSKLHHISTSDFNTIGLFEDDLRIQIVEFLKEPSTPGERALLDVLTQNFRKSQSTKV